MIIIGAAMTMLSGGQAKLQAMGLTLLLGGIICLLTNLYASRHPSGPLMTGYEIEGSRRRPARNYAKQLRDLKQLKDDGIISEEEFSAKKAEILAKKW